MKAKVPVTPQKAYRKAEEMCNRAEHCSGEIRKKLYDWGISPTDAAGIIQKLERARFIDDSRFAHLFARDRMEYLGWGKRKIAAALIMKHIERHIIREALDDLDNEIYTRRLLDIMRNKHKSLGSEAHTYDGRTKIFRHAISRGFEPQLVIETMKMLDVQ